MTWIIGHIFAAAIGMSLGLLGGGGSVLAVPVLVYVMGIAPKQAIAMTLVIVGIVSLLGSIPHWRKGRIELATVGLFGSSTMVGAFMGAKIAALPWMTGTVQMLLFAVMMLIAAIATIAKSHPDRAATEDEELDLYSRPVCKYCWLWLLTEGLGVGILTGLVGVGGGFAIVPALVLLGKIPMRNAIGTSLVIIALNSIAAVIGYVGQVNFDWQLITSFTLVAAFGTLIGSYFSEFIPARRLQQSFGYFLLVVATFVLFQNRHQFLPKPTSNLSEIQLETNRSIE